MTHLLLIDIIYYQSVLAFCFFFERVVALCCQKFLIVSHYFIVQPFILSFCQKYNKLMMMLRDLADLKADHLIILDVQ